jgi:hypothetical protein
VQGEVAFDEQAQAFTGATLFVSLRKTTLMDTHSDVIAREVVKDVAYDPGTGNTIAFIVWGNVPDLRDTYTIDVLLDLNGDGQISRGDYINAESYRVLTRGYPSKVSVKVTRV